MVVGEELYKCSPSGILQKCIPADQGRELLLEIHVGICGHHTFRTSLVGKAFRHVWGFDLVGPFRRALGGYTHLLVVVNKFTKWIEVKPVTKVMLTVAAEFFLNIVYRFRVPNSTITNNSTQFMGRKFLRFYGDYHIWVDWASVAYPRTNGQVERANGMVLQGLKPRIFDGLKNFAGR
ncbi:uncharacterized protein [Setaria viridis]|uniref:uncharacterized protein n=1 Tax=Setaria viridis TaxID=4556 RepID=UPI001493319A|nr:uncharacterized protein LOC117856439 [Setaria viridis]